MKSKAVESVTLLKPCNSAQGDKEVWVHYPEGTRHWQDIKERPVWCSRAEALAFCRSQGCRLMSEAEYKRADDCDATSLQYVMSPNPKKKKTLQQCLQLADQLLSAIQTTMLLGKGSFSHESIAMGLLKMADWQSQIFQQGFSHHERGKRF